MSKIFDSTLITINETDKTIEAIFDDCSHYLSWTKGDAEDVGLYRAHKDDRIVGMRLPLKYASVVLERIPTKKESLLIEEEHDIHKTEWAKAFKSDNPSQYDEAIKKATNPNFQCEIIESREYDEFSWYAVVDVNEPDFWMDGFPTVNEARAFVKQMNWKKKL